MFLFKSEILLQLSARVFRAFDQLGKYIEVSLFRFSLCQTCVCSSSFRSTEHAPFYAKNSEV